MQFHYLGDSYFIYTFEVNVNDYLSSCLPTNIASLENIIYKLS